MAIWRSRFCPCRQFLWICFQDKYTRILTKHAELLLSVHSTVHSHLMMRARGRSRKTSSPLRRGGADPGRMNSRRSGAAPSGANSMESRQQGSWVAAAQILRGGSAGSARRRRKRQNLTTAAPATGGG